MIKDLVCICIPIYKNQIDENEEKSLRQCLLILKNYPIFLVCSENLNIENYITLNSNLNVKRFKNVFFENVQGYNKLMISNDFYEKFDNFKFMLIYQLDAFVFRDELKYWCNLEFDYIGAPWCEVDSLNNIKFYQLAGNGGFSLRKIDSHLNVLKSYKFYKRPKEILLIELKNLSFLNFSYRIPLLFLKCLGFRNTFKYFIKKYKSNEDIFWVEIVQNHFPKFKVAHHNEAISFSFECLPSILFKMNNFKLPFGCHAWVRYENDFWSKFIN
jgi:hypothetical protein